MRTVSNFTKIAPHTTYSNANVHTLMVSVNEYIYIYIYIYIYDSVQQAINQCVSFPGDLDSGQYRTRMTGLRRVSARRPYGYADGRRNHARTTFYMTNHTCEILATVVADQPAQRNLIIVCCMQLRALHNVVASSMLKDVPFRQRLVG